MEIKSIKSAKINTEKKSVIVTGVTGQDGSIMTDYLLKNTDYIIYGAARRLSVENHKNIKHITDPRFVLFSMDITDPHAIDETVMVLKPDYFINLAAQSFVKASWDIPANTWHTNCTSVMHMLEAIRKHAPHCRYYNAGSSEEMGDVLYFPQNEKHPARPRSPYGASKAAARQLVKVYRESYQIYAIQGWLYNHEGTRRGAEFVTRKITKAVSHIKKCLESGTAFQPLLLGNLDVKRDWGDSEDFVKAIWMMLNQDIYNRVLKSFMYDSPQPLHEESEPGEATKFRWLTQHVKDYVVGTGKLHSVREFVESAFNAAGISGFWLSTGLNEKYMSTSGRQLIGIDSQYFRPAEVELLWADPQQIKNDLNWEPTITFEDLVTKMVNYDIRGQ